MTLLDRLKAGARTLLGNRRADILSPMGPDAESPGARDALSAIQEFARQLDRFDGLSGHMAGVRAGLEPLLGFEFGARGERVRAAREAAAALGEKDRPLYLEPGPAPITRVSTWVFIASSRFDLGRDHGRPIVKALPPNVVNPD